MQFLSVSFNQDTEGAFLRQKGRENETEINKAQENMMAEFNRRILVQILEKKNRKKCLTRDGRSGRIDKLSRESAA
ncbi:MAG: hypothetical protein K6A68_14880 [Clostridiales bacterium]|nr:hypothetical protein [Clostridiales bacterium]